jgi:hypothetical protein
MPKLYEIAENIKQLEVVLEAMDEGDATFEAVEQYLNSLIDIDLTQKVENIAKYIKNLEANVEMYKAEKQRLDKLEKSTKKKMEGLHNYLATMLSSLGYNHKNKKKIQTSIGNVGFKKNPPTLQIVNIDKVPTEWDKPQKRDESCVRKADMLKHVKELIGDFKDLDEVELKDLGVKLVNNNSSLQIK